MRLHRSFVLVGLALGLVDGCGSVSGVNDGGGGNAGGGAAAHGGSSGGEGGRGGGAAGVGGGGAGSSGSDGGVSCGDLATQYADALPAAQSCNLNASGQCQQLVSSSLSPCFVNCMTYVSDPSTLNAIKASWEQAACNNVPVLCPAIACLQPTNNMCVVGDGGGGVCSSNGGVGGGPGGHAGAAGGGGAGAGGSVGGSGAGSGTGGSGGGGTGGGKGGTSGHGGAAAGAGGSSGSGGGAGSSFRGECAQASDCMLHDDCCTCASVPKTNPGATCNIACGTSLCSSRGITGADVTCMAGRCVLARSCNPKNVACAIAPPACSTGSLPAIAGGCYSGGCLPVAQCSDVPSCDSCTIAGLACVTDEVLGGPTYHCVTVPSACSAAPTCQCLGVCTGGFQCADPASTSPMCQCPAC